MHWSRRRDFDDRGVEIRRIDERGHLSEDHVHERTLFDIPSFTTSTFLAKSAAKTIESELQQIKEQIKSISRRVDALEEQNPAKAKRRKSSTSKMGFKKGIADPVLRPAEVNRASVCVRERKKWSAGRETAGTEPERNADAEPQTEVIPHLVLCRMVCDLGRFDWAPGFPRCGIKRRLVRAL